MVFYNKSALDDIEDIFVGLLNWTTKDNFQPRMSFEEVWNYRSSLFDEGFDLDKLVYRFNAKFESHKKFGQYVHRFDKNKRTQWYYIYDIDEKGDIYINKITNNYLTQN